MQGHGVHFVSKSANICYKERFLRLFDQKEAIYGVYKANKAICGATDEADKERIAER